jgi:hypothetical protein
MQVAPNYACFEGFTQSSQINNRTLLKTLVFELKRTGVRGGCPVQHITCSVCNHSAAPNLIVKPIVNMPIARCISLLAVQPSGPLPAVMEVPRSINGVLV